jgi:hypothetical protein
MALPGHAQHIPAAHLELAACTMQHLAGLLLVMVLDVLLPVLLARAAVGV